MDTSTSAQSSLDFVLKGPSRVAPAQFSPGDWLEIVRHELELVKPHLNQMTGWRTLQDVLERPWPDAPAWEVLKPTISEGVRSNLQERCRFITSRRFRVPVNEYNDWPQEYVLLRQDGTWLQVDAVSHQLAYGHTAYEFRDVRITLLDDEGLLRLLEYDQGRYGTRLGYQLVQQLTVMVHLTPRKRRKWLEQLESLDARVGQTLTRMRPPQ